MRGRANMARPLCDKYILNIMEYLTLKEIKQQCVIDPQFDGDDEFLELIGNAAESMTEKLLNCPLDEITAMNGDLPAGVRHAMRMLVDYFYSINRGSSENTPDIPNAVLILLKLYRSFR